MRLLLHPSDQPVFRLAVRVAQCRIDVRVNDVPIFSNTSGDSLFFELPVNQWLFQGRNDIDLRLKPVEDGAWYGQHAELEVVLQHKIARDAQKNIIEVGKLEWQPGNAAPYDEHPHSHSHEALPPVEEEDDAPLLALPGQDEECPWRHYPVRKAHGHEMQITTSLSLPPPWPACPWQRADALSGDTGAQFSVERLTRSFHDGLRHGGWEELAKVRRAALQSAYYLTEAEVDEALSFPKLVRDEAWSLQSLPEKGLELEIAGNGRLAKLVNAATRQSPVVFINEKEAVTAEIGAWWMFGGQWIMIR